MQKLAKRIFVHKHLLLSFLIVIGVSGFLLLNYYKKPIEGKVAGVSDQRSGEISTVATGLQSGDEMIPVDELQAAINVSDDKLVGDENFQVKINADETYFQFKDENGEQYQVTSSIDKAIGKSQDQQVVESETSIDDKPADEIDREKIKYNDVVENVDIEQKVYNNKIKENLIIKDENAPTTFTYELKLSDNLELKTQGDKLVLTKPGGDRILVNIENPFAIDQSGGRYDFRYLISGNTITLEPSSDLSSAVYPLTIDPSYSVVATVGTPDYTGQRKLARTSNGDLYAVYHRSTGQDNVYIAKSTDGGQTWAETALTSSADYWSRYPSIAVDSNDYIHVAWTGTNATNSIYSQIYYRKYTGSWQSAVKITDVNYTQNAPSIAIDSSNYIHLAWVGGSTSTTGILRYAKYTDSWQAIQDLTVAGTDSIQYLASPSIAIDNNNYIHIAWTGRHSGSTSIYQARYIEYTDSWQAIVNLSSESYGQWNVNLALDSSGNPHVAWDGQYSGSTTYRQIHYKNYSGGSWQATQHLSSDIYDEYAPCLSIDASNNINLAWYGVMDETYLYKISYRQYTSSWSARTTIGNDATNSTRPSFMWANYPNISGSRTNRPSVGYLFTGRYSSDLYFQASGDLSWVDPPSGITISGTCQQYDQSASCADSETVKVAVNGVLQAQTGTTSSGSWSISGVTPPSASDVVTVFIDGVADDLEANAVTVYDGTGDITGVNLYERHLSLGSDDNQTMTNANISAYDNSVSSDEDIFYDVDANNDLTVPYTGTQTSTDQEIIIKASNTYRPDSASSGNITTPNLEIPTDAVLTADNNTITLSASSAPLTIGGTFTVGSSTIIYSGSSATSITATTYYNLTVGGSGTFTLAGSTTVSGALSQSAGTLSLSDDAYTLSAGTMTITGGTFAIVNQSSTRTKLTSGDFALTTGTFNNGNYSYVDLNGTFTQNSGTITNSATGGRFYVSGDFTYASGSYPTTGSTLFDGNTAHLVSGPSGFGIVTMTKTAGQSLILDADMNIAGDYYYTSGTLDCNGNNLVMTGATSNIYGNSGTIGNLKISGTVVSNQQIVTVSSNLIVDEGKKFQLSASNYVTLTDAARLTLNGTIDSATVNPGRIVFTDDSGTNLPLTGTLAGRIRFLASTKDITIPARTYAGRLDIMNSGSSDRVATLGTDTGQTITVGGDARDDIVMSGMIIITDGTGKMTVRGDTYDPDVVITSSSTSWNYGDLNFLGSGIGVRELYAGDGTWTVAGDVDFTNGTFHENSSNFVLNGAGSQTQNIIPDSNSFNNLTIQNTSTSGSIFSTSMNITGALIDITPNSKITFHAGSTYNVGSLNIAGSSGNLVTLQSSSTSAWTIGATTVTGVSYADVTYSTSSGDEICATYSTGSNNTNWDVTALSYCVVIPTVTTGAASGVGQTDATLNGNITSTGNENATVRGFKYSSVGEQDDSETYDSGDYGTGAYTKLLESLVANKTYYVRAYATNSKGTGYGSWVQFTTSVPSIAFSSTSSSGAESVTSVNITVAISDISSTGSSVDYTVAGTATGGGVDYTLADGTATVTAGGTSTNVNLVVVSDSLYENDETVIVTLSNPTNVTLGANDQFTYTITNDDSQPSIAFTTDSASGSEATTPVSIEISLSAASGLDSSVDYTVTGTATGGGVDYTLADGTATVTAGGTTTNLSLVVVNDVLDEADETVIVTISNPTNATLGVTTEYTYTITDNDNPPTIAFSTDSGSGAESISPIGITVSLSTVSGRDVSVDYTASGGTASGSGVDYTLTAGTLTISAGESAADIALSVINDTLDEDSETMILTLSNPTNATLGVTTEYTYTITDNDDPPTVGFVSASDSGLESVTSVSISVSLSAATSKTVTVDYTVTGTATGGGVDYTLSAGTVSILAGQTSSNLTLSVINDAAVEDDETVILTLTNPTNSTLGTNSQYTYTVVDNDTLPAAGVASANGSSSNTADKKSAAATSAESGSEQAEDLPEVAKEPESYSLKIFVADKDGNPVAGARVELHSDVQIAYSDESGFAYFASVPTGKHKVKVSYDGYSGEKEIIVTGEKEKVEISVTVEPNSSRIWLWVIVGVLVGVLALSLVLVMIRKKRQKSY